MTYKGLIHPTKHNDYYNKILRATKYILPNSKKKINEPYYIKKTPNTYLEIK